MRAKKDSFSIVIIGSWNPSIFNQDWILTNLCTTEPKKIAVAFPIDDPTAPRKIDFEDISLFPGRRQIIIQPQNATIDGIKKCSVVAANILRLLVHTPVSHCGINFSFVESNQLEKIFGVLNFSDGEVINKQKYKLEESNVVRKFHLQDGNFLNLTLSDNQGIGQLAFNFHYEASDIMKYRKIFESNNVEERYTEAISFCKSVYSLDLEEG